MSLFGNKLTTAHRDCLLHCAIKILLYTYLLTTILMTLTHRQHSSVETKDRNTHATYIKLVRKFAQSSLCDAKRDQNTTFDITRVTDITMRQQ